MAIAFPRRNQAVMQVECYCDSDWASHHTVARRFVSGGVLYVNNCLMLSWSRGQAVTAMSSGEAEFYFHNPGRAGRPRAAEHVD